MTIKQLKLKNTIMKEERKGVTKKRVTMVFSILLFFYGIENIPWETIDFYIGMLAISFVVVRHLIIEDNNIK